MSSTRQAHNRAMELFESALVAAQKGDEARSRQLFKEALQMETAAADSVAENYALEPTRSVLHRSAATMALKIGDVQTAQRYAEAGLRGDPPDEIREELDHVRQQAVTLEAETFDYSLKPPPKETPVQRIIRQFTATAPVNIVGLAEALGLAVREIDLGPKTSGEIFSDLHRGGPSGFTIYVHAADPPTRKRFTVAHEVAHFLRHRRRISNRLIDDRMYRSGLGRTVESEANRLASQLLIPGRLLEESQLAGITNPEELAAEFNVSLQVMKIRLGIRRK